MTTKEKAHNGCNRAGLEKQLQCHYSPLLARRSPFLRRSKVCWQNELYGFLKHVSWLRRDDLHSMTIDEQRGLYRFLARLKAQHGKV